MFNATSRAKCRSLLQANPITNSLVPLFDLLHGQPVHQWYDNKSRHPQKFDQQEGFPQGCPLSPLLACIVLGDLATRLNTELAARAQQRLASGTPGDDNRGSKAHTTSIMDDKSVCLSHTDLPWFIRRFQELGDPMGIHLSCSKTKILTSTNGISPISALPAEAAAALTEALSLLAPSDPHTAELTIETRFLGYPIGNANFAQTFIQKKITELRKHTDSILQLPNVQTKAIMYRFSIATSINHLLSADILTAPSHDSDDTIGPVK